MKAIIEGFVCMEVEYRTPEDLTLKMEEFQDECVGRLLKDDIVVRLGKR